MMNERYGHPILWLLLMIVVSMVVSISMFNILNDTSYDKDRLHSKNVDMCLDKHDTWNFTSRNACASVICKDLNMSQSNAQTWLETEVSCRTEHGGSIDVDICSSPVDECRKLCIDRLNVQSCLYEWGIDYEYY